ncbi:MarR family winged helix-turn-helix transcriptional regulator [Sphingomonas sp. Root710]|uniref:MarR family winged helix-turn-helix transcriptional regulator n=1 Tax=Sphingomonas sp. Root710 TaxID=1736594 RepID=UPI0009E96D70|nr:MarR family transcriptional regulator [Sphingomonas sp. Root710]
MIEATLRPYDLGSTQWYVLYQLANHGPTGQRELGSLLQIEKPTLTEVVNALVRKGLVRRLVDPADQRQRILELTASGRALWTTLPDPIGLIQTIAFEGVDESDLLTIKTVLRAATERITHHARKDSSK